MSWNFLGLRSSKEHEAEYKERLRLRDEMNHAKNVRKIALLEEAGDALHRAADALSKTTYDPENHEFFALDKLRRAEIDAAMHMLESAGFISTEIERVT